MTMILEVPPPGGRDVAWRKRRGTPHPPYEVLLTPRYAFSWCGVLYKVTSGGDAQAIDQPEEEQSQATDIQWLSQ